MLTEASQGGNDFRAPVVLQPVGHLADAFLQWSVGCDNRDDPVDPSDEIFLDVFSLYDISLGEVAERKKMPQGH